MRSLNGMHGELDWHFLKILNFRKEEEESKLKYLFGNGFVVWPHHVTTYIIVLFFSFGIVFNIVNKI